MRSEETNDDTDCELYTNLLIVVKSVGRAFERDRRGREGGKRESVCSECAGSMQTFVSKVNKVTATVVVNTIVYDHRTSNDFLEDSESRKGKKILDRWMLEHARFVVVQFRFKGSCKVIFDKLSQKFEFQSEVRCLLCSEDDEGMCSACRVGITDQIQVLGFSKYLVSSSLKPA